MPGGEFGGSYLVTGVVPFVQAEQLTLGHLPEVFAVGRPNVRRRSLPLQSLSEAVAKAAEKHLGRTYAEPKENKSKQRELREG